MATFDNTERENAVKAKLFADTIPRMPPIARFGCETARRRFVEIDGLRLSFLEWGIAGCPVICFLHGGSAHAHWFDLVAPAFVDRFHVIALDQRGHGEHTAVSPPALGAGAVPPPPAPREGSRYGPPLAPRRRGGRRARRGLGLSLRPGEQQRAPAGRRLVAPRSDRRADPDRARRA